MTNKRSIKSVYMAVLALFLFVVGLLGGRQMLSAFADEKAYTNVLADLQKDATFTVADYPEQDEDFLKNSDNAHIQVIQIAESKSGELFLYTYQPCQKVVPLTATEINMALSETVDGTSLFPLTLLNTNGVFCKYLVNGVIVSKDAVRYYNITSIYRDWDKDIDGETGNDNTGNAKAYAVGKQYTVETKNGSVTYSCKDVDVVEIINPYVDFLDYYDGLKWDFIFNATHYTNVHYIAFDTDFPIGTLKEADVAYVTQSYLSELGAGDNTTTYGEKSAVQYKTLTGETDGGNAGDGLFGVKYTWKCIQSTATFIQSVNLGEVAEKEVKKTKWVLLFLETPFTRSEVSTFSGHKIRKSGTKVSEVTVLRLNFVTAGKTYNLGTVSDKLTGDDIAGGGAPKLGWLDLLCKWLEQVTGVPALVWKIVICALPFIILLPILSAVFPVVGQILLAVFKGIWWLICLPFKGIAAFCRRIRGA